MLWIAAYLAGCVATVAMLATLDDSRNFPGLLLLLLVVAAIWPLYVLVLLLALVVAAVLPSDSKPLRRKGESHGTGTDQTEDF